MKYLEINKCDAANGPGIRISLWPSGCNIHCEGCHNKGSWNPERGKDFTAETMEEILKLLEPDHIAGLSILGGDPMFPANRECISEICKTVKEKYPNKYIWIWTGYKFEIVKDEPAMKYIDYCVDGPFILSQRDVTLKFRGSRNQRIIDVQKSLKENETKELQG